MGHCSHEYGGGGLTLYHPVVIDEEVDAVGLNVPPYYDSGGRLGGTSRTLYHYLGDPKFHRRRLAEALGL